MNWRAIFCIGFYVGCVGSAGFLWAIGDAALAEYRENSVPGWRLLGVICWALTAFIIVYLVEWLGGSVRWPPI